jgi:arginase family enzyme
MRLVPVLFPSDLGRGAAGTGDGGTRGAPDRLLDVLEGQGVRFAKPISVPVGALDGDGSPWDEVAAQAVLELADAVERVNAEADFPVVLGGDHYGLLGHVLGHSRRFGKGIGLGLLCEASLDLEDPQSHPDDGIRSVLAGVLGLWSDATPLGRTMAGGRVRPERASVAGVRRSSREARTRADRSGIEVWSMERLELDGETAYRSVLTQHLERGPIALSIDVGGLDPDLMTAVADPVPDGLEWSFLKRSLEQCVPHIDRILGLDICELDPSRDDAHQGALTRFAETVGPFLRRLSR